MGRTGDSPGTISYLIPHTSYLRLPAASISVPLRFLRSHPYLQMILLPLDFFATRCYIMGISGFAPKGA